MPSYAAVVPVSVLRFLEKQIWDRFVTGSHHDKQFP